jgi:hypothetical protein
MSSCVKHRGVTLTAVVILFLVTMCGQSSVEIDPYESISKQLGKPVDEHECDLFMQATFTVGMEYEEVHRRIDEIGDKWIVDEIPYAPGGKIEIIEIQTGSVPLKDYDYLKWNFVFDEENKLIKVNINSWM